MDEHRDWGWRVVNYAKYRAIRDEDDRREQNRLAQESWRNKNKPPSAAVSQGKPQSAHTEAEAYTDTGKTARKRAAPVAQPPDVDAQVWTDWLQLRRNKRAPVTATVLEGAKAEAAKAGMTLDAFLRVWCRRGSQSLEAEWLKPAELSTGRGSLTVPKSESAEQRAWKAEQAQRDADLAQVDPAEKARIAERLAQATAKLRSV
mgnify:FL=1